MAGDASNESEPVSAEKPARLHASVPLRRWWFVVVVLVAVLELVLHLVQSRDMIEDADWAAVKSTVETQTQPEDLVVVSPRWVDPLGRMQLGDALMTTRRVARADESRFPKATEVALGGAHSGELESWTVEGETDIGPFVVRRLVNPAYRPIVDDLVAHAQSSKLDVSKVGASSHPCTWRKGASATGALGFGPAAPAERFHCDRGAWVAETIVADLDYAPRRCIYAPPPGGNDVLRLRFHEVKFGKRLEGHHALYVEAERDRKGSPIHISFSSGGNTLGEARHEDGQGWVEFAFDTPSLAGTTAELIAEISSKNGSRRMYCFEATTR